MVKDRVGDQFVVTDVLDDLPRTAAVRLEDRLFFTKFVVDALAVDGKLPVLVCDQVEEIRAKALRVEGAGECT